MPRPLDTLPFDNRFLRALPEDPSPDNRPRPVTGAAYSRVTPQRTAAPRTLAVAREVAEALGIDETDRASDDFAAVFSGNRVPDGAEPHATCYGGHQFGHWAGQLGDGRAIALGEVRGTDGAHHTLQLKGAGPTPYSRRADGLAVLRSSVREFLCSEAMHHLGVPTTRALSLVLTGDSVLRDMFYDGNAAHEPGAVVCRVAPSFTRFGHFELPASRGDRALLQQLTDHTLAADFPELAPGAYAELFGEVVRRTADLMVDWMRVGFVHGVMNTDNLSILGLTIDYGPYGWLEPYEPGWTPNTTDAAGRRYAYGNQPGIGQWNLLQLARALAPLVEDLDRLQAAIDGYGPRYEAGFRAMMAAKLGLVEHKGDDDDALIVELLEVLQAAETDMTLFFRGLADVEAAGDSPASIEAAYYGSPAADARARMGAWLARYRARLRAEGVADARRRAAMNAVNPRYVLRNYLAQLAIDDAERGDPALIGELLDVLRRPYDEQPGRERFAEKRPEWARNRPGCSMLSCSS